VPTTHDVLTALFHPSYPKSHIDLINLFLLGSQLVLFALLPRSVSRPFFLLYFAFWRAAYDAGLGWVLTQQSKRRWIVREVQRRGWLDGNKRPKTRAWIREQLAGKMGKDYSFDVSLSFCRADQGKLRRTLPTPLRKSNRGPWANRVSFVGSTIGIQHMALVSATRRYHPPQVRSSSLLFF
jgi:hypothetical protein